MTLTRRGFLAVSIAACGACGRSPGARSDILRWGGEGLRDGSFLRPRAIGVHRGEVYVIDTTGRIQVFAGDGGFARAWSTPSAKNGTPTGVSFTADDRVLVPDTHYSRILEYTMDGALTMTWGTYGTGESEFIYPTDVALDDDGRMYIAEYGEGAHRIHVFNADLTFADAWGDFGEEPGQFNRAMAIDRDSRGRFYVADTGNHRAQVLDREGGVVRVLGAADRPVNAVLNYPYDLAVAPDDSVLVADYGSHAIVRYDADGNFVARFGGPGRGPGEFNGPRGVCVSPEGIVYIADTDNHRVQRIALGAIA